MRYLAVLLLIMGFSAHAPKALAAGLPAGFAPASIWVSKSPLSDGDAATIYAALYDSSDTSLEGDLVFTDNGATFATQHFSLAAGASRVASASWTAHAGTHAIGVALANISGADSADALMNGSAESITVTVATRTVATSTPERAVATASNIATNAFSVAESARQDAANAIEHALEAASTSPEGQVLGTSTSRVPPAATAWFSRAWRAFLSGLLYICSSRFWFYLLALLALYFVYKVIRAAFADRRYRYR